MVSVQDHGSSALNVSGTGEQIDTPLTQVGSRAVRYRLIDKDGRADGRSFESITQLQEWARFLWPDQEQDPDRTGAGWDVEAVR